MEIEFIFVADGTLFDFVNARIILNLCLPLQRLPCFTVAYILLVAMTLGYARG